MTARFWVWWNDGWVKLSLRKARPLFVSTFSYTDEGWSREECSWEFDGRKIIRSWTIEEKDCDGRLDRYGDEETDILHLKDCESPDSWEQGIKFPSWRKVDSSQRDEYAELAGY